MDKYVFKMLFIFAIFCIAFNAVKADENLLYGKCVYVDPGHGGTDPGAIYANIKEEDINLAIALKLKNELEKVGSIVYLTREGDYDLSSNSKRRKQSDLYRRSVIINESGCDVYLSIHLNAMAKTIWSGAQVFYDDVNKNNKKLAESIQNEFKKNLNTNRKYKEISNGYMYQRIRIPGVLVEAGFISNPNERSKLLEDEYQLTIVKSIINGLNTYFKNL